MDHRASPASPPPPAHAGDAPLIVFDGVCILCSRFVAMVLWLDKKQQFRFATAQSPFGEALYRQHGLRTDVYDTVLVLIEGKAYVKLDAFIAVMGQLGWPWRAARILMLMPRRRRDFVYGLVANNRYRLFGRKDSCDIPSPELRRRFLG